MNPVCPHCSFLDSPAKPPWFGVRADAFWGGISDQHTPFGLAWVATRDDKSFIQGLHRKKEEKTKEVVREHHVFLMWRNFLE